MLEEKDLQAIAKLMAQQKQEILEQSATNMRVILESAVRPQFDLLAENQRSILEKVAPKSRVEELEEKVNFLESIMRSMNKDLQELKKAQ